MAAPEKFLCHITDAAIGDLHARIDAMRWPGDFPDEHADYGIPAPYLRELVHHWRHEFNWRAWEAKFNATPQFKLTIDGLVTHFLHARSPHPGAATLLLTHGWPGSIFEFSELIPRLTEPEKFGGNPADAYHVVAPSLAGYGFSDPATGPGMSPRAIAARHVKLMQALGIDRYIAQGGDWGSVVSTHTAGLDPSHCAGLHLNMVAPIPPSGVPDPMALVAPHEMKFLARTQAFRDQGMGYFALQSTKPNTLGFALNDSPVGLCAWIAEKFLAWTDCAAPDGSRDIRNALSWDQMLANISLYWFTGSAASAARIYREHTQSEARGEKTPPPTQKTAVAAFPEEILMAPRQWAERTFKIVQWDDQESGGHFAAMEKPQALAESLWHFKHRVEE